VLQVVDLISFNKVVGVVAIIATFGGMLLAIFSGYPGPNTLGRWRRGKL